MAANQECQDRGLFGKKDEGRQDGDMMQNQHLRPNPNPAQKSGLVDKVKEKLPGGQTQTAQCNPQIAQRNPQTAQHNPAEKIPGGHTQTAQCNPQTAQRNPQTAQRNPTEKIPGGHTQNPCETADCNPGEKKGLGDKIKERLAGGRNKE